MKRRSPWRVLARLLLVLALGPAVPILALRWIPPPTTSFMLQRQVHAIRAGESARLHHEWTPWRDLPPALRLAVVASEDQKFPEHWGFDVESIRDAARARTRSARPRGASTITQQVAKNLFLWPGRSWVRKGMEAYAALWIEILWPKRRVLEMYLNVAEFGDRVYGAGAAAEAFFDRPARRMTRRQAALLAAVLPSPRRFHAGRPSPYVARRADWIEGQMRQLGDRYLDPLE